MSKRILIVDDEPHMLRITDFSMKKAGYTTITARNGREAINLAQSALPDLIVMDVSMPEMDGIAALKELKASASTAKIPVIMLTSRGQNLTRDEAEHSGAALYVTKPFSPSALASEVRRIMDGPAVPNISPDSPA